VTPQARVLPLACALALAACGGDKDELGPPRRYPVPGCEQFEPAPCDVRTTACQQRLYGLAACLRGSDPGEPPHVVVITPDALQAELEAAAAQDQPDPHVAEWESAFGMLGLIQPGALERTAEIASEVNFIWGRYVDATKLVEVIDHGSDTTSETSSSVLLHEFVHAIQDREFELASFKQAHDQTYDSSLAASAIIEGEAQFHQERYLASMLGFEPNGVDWDRLFQDGVEIAEPKILGAPSPLTAAPQYFPYDWGARYVHLGWDATGHAGVLELFAAPPADTQLEMASIHGLAADVAGSDSAAPEPPAEWTQIGADRLGAIGVFELLGAHAELEAARSVALDWRADHLTVYAGTDAGDPAATAVVWSCDFASEASAGTVADVMGRNLGRTPQVTGTRVTFANASDGASLAWAFDGSSP
jgi:hypothetical protein